MAIRGNVDGMEGAYISGWAADGTADGHCEITVTGADGQLLAKGLASRDRPDLAVLGLGRTGFGFRIAVPHAAEARTLHVRANGQALPGAPVHTGPGLFSGQAYVQGDLLTGWVTELAAGAAPPFITVVDESGAEVARGRSRFEDRNPDPLFVPARFALRLDTGCFGAGEMRLRIFADGAGFAAAFCNLTLTGSLDKLTPGYCAGWLLSPQAPERALEIEIYRDGALLETVACARPRPDVTAIFPGAATPGFVTALKESPDAATVTLRLAGADRDLFEGPYAVAPCAAAVGAAYEAARLATLGLPDVSPAMRAVLGQAVRDYLEKIREEDGFTLPLQADSLLPAPHRPRVVVIIPVYRGVEETRACIESVLAHRNRATDRIVLVNDAAPEPGMRPMLEGYARQPNLTLLHNGENLGFIRTVNRGLAVADGADVLLLNADTVMFAGGLDELARIAHARPDIGTVTALSNNATIFSYPGAALRRARLEDVSWKELAALALRENAGKAEDVPTGHGFCLFIKGAVLRRVGHLDESFGRGYGEENDFCARAAALGYRSVAAGGVLVEHKESVSFEAEKAALLARNLPKLNAMYPEYTPTIIAFERRDGLRTLRWALDRARLGRAKAAGTEFVLVVSNALEGGTAKAIAEIEQLAGYGAAKKLSLGVTADGVLTLAAGEPLLAAGFGAGEVADLFALLDAAAPGTVLVHQLLGFPESFLEAFAGWLEGRHAVFWAHDFYPLCPRVTMIDAIGRFCGGAAAEVCARCVGMDGAHENSALTALAPAAHRALFGRLLGGFAHVLVPSADTAGHFGRIFPAVNFEVLPHHEPREGVAPGPRAGNDEEIVLLGAIGPHKGSGALLEIARRARLTHPRLHFRIIGFTDIDKELRAVGNVTITGKYRAEELPRLLEETRGRLALFLPAWPETYSYTLSELVRHGFIPLVPDIGAPAERVRAAGYGVVFPFPAEPEAVLAVIEGIGTGAVKPVRDKAAPEAFFADEAGLERLRAVIRPGAEVVEPPRPKAKPRGRAKARAAE